jgi:hypothetical protein
MMRATCRHNLSSDLAAPQRGRFADIESRYPLTIGRVYAVLGMGIWENVLNYLVCDDVGVPMFAPAGLFEPGGAMEIPDDWEFALCDGIAAEGKDVWTKPCAAVWGYHELVANPMHAAALEEGDGDARALFREELQRRGASCHLSETDDQ